MKYSNDGHRVQHRMKVSDYAGIPEGPGLIFIEGGRTVLGSAEEDVAMTRDINDPYEIPACGADRYHRLFLHGRS